MSCALMHGGCHHDYLSYLLPLQMNVELLYLESSGEEVLGVMENLKMLQDPRWRGQLAKKQVESVINQ